MKRYKERDKRIIDAGFKELQDELDKRFKELQDELDKQKKNWEKNRDKKAWVNIEFEQMEMEIDKTVERLKNLGMIIEHL